LTHQYVSARGELEITINTEEELDQEKLKSYDGGDNLIIRQDPAKLFYIIQIKRDGINKINLPLDLE